MRDFFFFISFCFRCNILLFLLARRIVQSNSLDDYKVETSVGVSLVELPIYYSSSGKVLGSYNEELTMFPNETDCIGTATLTFFDDPDDLSYSQITMQHTCNGEYKAITGGTGDYECDGFQIFSYVEEEDIMESDLYVCGKLCPAW
jgi:hypothetical protein